MARTPLTRPTQRCHEPVRSRHDLPCTEAGYPRAPHQLGSQRKRVGT